MQCKAGIVATNPLLRTCACLLVLGAASLLAGCAPPIIPEKFAWYTGCPANDVSTKEDRGPQSAFKTFMAFETFTATGCGVSLKFRCIGSRCQSPIIVIAKRHAAQFSCALRTVQVKDLGSGAWLAEGCNQRLTYQCVDDSEHALRCFAETTETPGLR
jgi:hypothetical protein